MSTPNPKPTPAPPAGGTTAKPQSDADKFISDAMTEFRAKQRELDKRWQPASATEYGFDQETGLLTLGFHDGRRIEARAQVIGSLLESDGTWEWAWHNPNVLPGVGRRSAAAKQVGEKLQIDYLSYGRFPLNKPRETALSLIKAAGVKTLGAEGVFEACSGPLTVFLAMSNTRAVESAGMASAIAHAEQSFKLDAQNIPASRAYIHQKCRSVTVIEGNPFSSLSSPISGSGTAKCNACGVEVDVDSLIWQDTGQTIKATRERWLKTVPAPLRLFSHPGIILLVALACMAACACLGYKIVGGGWLGWLLGVTGVIGGFVVFAVLYMTIDMIFLSLVFRLKNWRQLR